jgi:hypothetical protein
VNGAAGGTESSVTSTVSLAAGVVGPHVDVNRETPSGPGRWFSPFSGRRWLLPCQVPSIWTRWTSRVPSSVMPTVDRLGCGGVVRTPDCMNIPLGRPSSKVKRSALTPPTVAVELIRFCIDVTRSRPMTVLFESTGCSA